MVEAVILRDCGESSFISKADPIAVTQIDTIAMKVPKNFIRMVFLSYSKDWISSGRC